MKLFGIELGSKNVRFPVLPIHEYYNKNMIMMSQDKTERHKAYVERRCKPGSNKNNIIPIEVFYYTPDYNDVVAEMVSQFPMEMSVTGKNSAFIKENLIEYSYLIESTQKIYKENILGVDAFLLVIPQMNTDTNYKALKTFKFESIPVNEVWATDNIITGDMESCIVRQEKNIYTPEFGNQTVYVIRTFTMENVTVEVVDSAGNAVKGYSKTSMENPYKSIGVMPILRFKGVSDNGKPLATKFIESQLNMDDFACGLHNLVNMHSNPINVITGSHRDWSGISFGAGQTITLELDEDMKTLTSDMQLQQLNQMYDGIRDRMYKTAGLLPMSLRERVYASDSSRVAQLATKELQGSIMAIIQASKKPLDQLCKICLSENGKEYNGEAFQTPKSLSSPDYKEIFELSAMGLNLELVDNQWIRDMFFTDMQPEDKIRIDAFFKNRKEEAMNMRVEETKLLAEASCNTCDSTSTPKSTIPNEKPLGGNNVDNRAKVTANQSGATKQKPISNKNASKASGKEMRRSEGKSTVS